MRGKLGLADAEGAERISAVIDGLLPLLQANRVDYTSFFRALGSAARGDAEPVRSLFVDLGAWDEWAADWRALEPDAAAMDRANPVYIPRNHLVEEALAGAAGGDLQPLHTLLEAVAQPYAERPGLEHCAAPAPVDFGAYRTFCGT
jgi:uncharacterized protein YdiU (UPF0061 family)